MRRFTTTLIAGALAAGSARAQSTDVSDQDVDIELFKPPGDGMGYLTVPSAATLRHLQIGGTLWFSYMNDPMVLVRDGVRTAPIGAAVSGDDGDGIVDDRLGGNVMVGIGLSRYFSFTFDVPLILWQDGYNINTIDNPAEEPLPLITSGVGDLRFIFKGVALDLDTLPVGLAVILPVSLPTGNGGSFLGEEAYSLTPTGVLEFSDGSISLREYKVRGAFTAGYHVRDLNRVRGVELGNGFVYGVGFGVRPAEPVELLAEFHGELSGPDAAQRAGELNFGLKGLLGKYVSLNGGVGFGLLSGVGTPDWRLMGGVTVAPSLDPFTLDADKDGIVNGRDQCVKIPEDKDDFQDDDGCPDLDNDRDKIEDDEDTCPDDPEDYDRYQDRDGCPDRDNDKDGIWDVDDQCPDDPETVNEYRDEDGCPDERPIEDTDGDGLKDDVDRCPLDPEDFDGFQDEDGCPEPDNDGDSFLDVDDACPNEREIFNGVADDDGCPDEGRVVVEKASIRILDVIYFEFAKATIQPVSFSLLDEIAAVILANPDIRRIRIEGHTDNVGDDIFNLKLSQARAESVREALIARGVDAGRLDAAGFGEMRPIASNDTDEGRQQNRRVEFLIVERD